jgi:hypothetical protein
MDDFQNFVTKAAELYSAAPLFFNWAAPIVVAFISGLVWLAYWLGGKFADSEINGLTAQALVLNQHVSFAKDQAEISAKEAAGLKARLETLNEQITRRATPVELQDSTSLIEGNLARLIGANTAASESLGHVSTGIDAQGRLTWRPIRPDEAEELLGRRK